MLKAVPRGLEPHISGLKGQRPYHLDDGTVTPEGIEPIISRLKASRTDRLFDGAIAAGTGIEPASGG